MEAPTTTTTTTLPHNSTTPAAVVTIEVVWQMIGLDLEVCLLFLFNNPNLYSYLQKNMRQILYIALYKYFCNKIKKFLRIIDFVILILYYYYSYFISYYLIMNICIII